MLDETLLGRTRGSPARNLPEPGPQALIQGHRSTVFQRLESTFEWKPERWRRLDDLHRFRNRFDYGDIVTCQRTRSI